MGTKSKLFRVFVEGNTVSDGRTITSAMIDEIVATFNAETYSPRINVEHISGYSPEPPFNGYGDVIAVEARDDKFTIDGKEETRRALYGQVDGNDQLVGLAKVDQKPFPSVELTDNFAGTGKIGLIGLAFTDKPASIGTQRLQFSRVTGTVIATSPDRAAIEFEAAPVDEKTVLDQIKGFFAQLAKGQEPEKPKEEVKQKPANDNDLSAFATAMGDTVAASIAAAMKPVTAAQAQMATDFAVLKTKLETTEQPGPLRVPSTGGGNGVQTDC